MQIGIMHTCCSAILLQVESRIKESAVRLAYRKLGGFALKVARGDRRQVDFAQAIAEALDEDFDPAMGQRRLSFLERGVRKATLEEFLVACDVAQIPVQEALALAAQEMVVRDAGLLLQPHPTRDRDATRVDQVIGGLRSAGAADHPQSDDRIDEGKSGGTSL